MNKTDSHSIFSTYFGIIEDSSCVANQEHAFGFANPHLPVVPNVYNKLICTKWKCSSLANNYSGGRMHHVANCYQATYLILEQQYTVDVT